MLRRLFLITCILCSVQAIAQRRPSTKIIVDASFGSSNAVEPYTIGYRSSTFGLFHAEVGTRILMNDYFGYRILAGYDNIENAKDGKSLPFKTTYYRGSAEAIIDLGELLKFDQFTTAFGLFLHGGVGYSRLTGSGKSEGMAHFVNGLTVNLFISKRMSLNFDLTRVNHVYQQIKFDMQSAHSELGFDGLIFNMSLGLSFQFGKMR
jgi:OmpA-OmpF porin, OOP family